MEIIRMQILIQELTENYLKDTIEVAVRAFGAEARQDALIDFPNSLSSPARPLTTLIALKNGKVVGASQCAHAFLTPEAYSLSWVCVDPDHQGQGIGTIIVEETCDYIERSFMNGKKGTIMLTAHAAPEFYAQFGFIKGAELHFQEPIMFKFVEGK